MPFCDQCGAENPDWARFCDQCGNPLIAVSQEAPAAPAGPAAASPPAAPAISQCPQCGTQVLPGEAFCDNCGAPLIDQGAANQGAPGSMPPGVPPQPNYPAPQPFEVPTMPSPPPDVPSQAPPPPPSPPAANPTPAVSKRASLAGASLYFPAKNVSLPLPSAERALIGRLDSASGIYPDIDLTPYGGIEEGVGRRHMVLQVRQGQVFAEDLDSTNGTYVNGQRLQPQTPQPVNSGDELRLGRFMLRLQW